MRCQWTHRRGVEWPINPLGAFKDEERLRTSSAKELPTLFHPAGEQGGTKRDARKSNEQQLQL